ncbi:MAG: PLP-dependent aminotransferase family protein [Oscillospiraceae bacterium]|nr:PLP-dependent aminotransferase family protein [Oscillospiraceae bacterium]
MKISPFLKDENNEAPLYIQLYMYYRKLIESGQLSSSTKLMSIRRCCEEFSLSKTTVETAYQQLAAEGYIQPKAQSGYYVCNLDFLSPEKAKVEDRIEDNRKKYIKYDFTSSALDEKSFDFSLWSRYIKGALKQNEKLTSYGEAQGEFELRRAISLYVSKYRSAVCTEKQIIIGAGTQSLIHILCAVLKEKCTVAFIGTSFDKGEAIFRDHGFDCMRFEDIPENTDILSENNVKLIYISPSHFTKFGDVLPISKRLELISYARKSGCIIIEDDYDSEFRYYSKPVPSLQGIAGGSNVIYLGTFSKLLLPSIRISFMILPIELVPAYSEVSALYNQTASKLEQLAVCRYIRDGHLSSQIKKQRKIFNSKADLIKKKASELLGDKAKVTILPAGYLVMIELCGVTAEKAAQKAESRSIKVKPVSDGGKESLILSCTGISFDDIDEAVRLLSQVILSLS